MSRSKSIKTEPIPVPVQEIPKKVIEIKRRLERVREKLTEAINGSGLEPPLELDDVIIVTSSWGEEFNGQVTEVKYSPFDTRRLYGHWFIRFRRLNKDFSEPQRVFNEYILSETAKVEKVTHL